MRFLPKFCFSHSHLGGWDFPLPVFPPRCCGRARDEQGRREDSSRIPLHAASPSAGLFQHLIIYRRLCGQLYRGSYCLIELLDSSAAKIGTGVEKKKKKDFKKRATLLAGQHGKQGQQDPLGKIHLSRGNLGCCHLHPISALAPSSSGGRGRPQGAVPEQGFSSQVTRGDNEVPASIPQLSQTWNLRSSQSSAPAFYRGVLQRFRNSQRESSSGLSPPLPAR